MYALHGAILGFLFIQLWKNHGALQVVKRDEGATKPLERLSRVVEEIPETGGRRKRNNIHARAFQGERKSLYPRIEIQNRKPSKYPSGRLVLKLFFQTQREATK